MIVREKTPEWWEENKELIEKSDQITKEFKEKFTPIFLENIRRAEKEAEEQGGRKRKRRGKKK